MAFSCRWSLICVAEDSTARCQHRELHLQRDSLPSLQCLVLCSKRWSFPWYVAVRLVWRCSCCTPTSAFTELQWFYLHPTHLDGKKDCIEQCSAVRWREQIRSYPFSNFSDFFISWYLSTSDPSESSINVILKAPGTIQSCGSVLLDNHTVYKWLCFSKKFWVEIFYSIFCYRNNTSDLGSG